MNVWKARTIFTKTDFQNPYTEDIFINFKFFFSTV